jgi:hypothetical protein
MVFGLLMKGEDGEAPPSLDPSTTANLITILCLTPPTLESKSFHKPDIYISSTMAKP